MSSLPEDIQIDIFLRLPVNSIGICRCVCKPWRKLIFSPKFIMCHRDHRPSLVFKGTDSSVYPSVYSVDYASLSSPTMDRRYGAVQLNYPSVHEAGLYTDSIAFDILGSCYGLICLGLYRATASKTKNFKEINNICVWNPKTREYKKIPLPRNFNQTTFNVVSYGFGYDSLVDDYKFVRIVHRKKCNHSKLEVYTLGSGSWKTIEKIPYSFHKTREHPGLFLNGALHWLGVNTTFSSEVIISFDIIHERLIDVSIPEETVQRYKHVGVLTDCLCLISSSRDSFDVWALLDYGVKESWTKQFIVLNANVLNPLWIQNDELLMVTYCNFVSHDPKEGKLEDVLVFAAKKDNVKMRNSDNASYCYYVESLVSLNSGTYLKKRLLTET